MYGKWQKPEKKEQTTSILKLNRLNLLMALCPFLTFSFPLPNKVLLIQFSLAMTKLISSFTTTTLLVLKSYRRLLWTSPGPSTLSITVPVLSSRTDLLCREAPAPLPWSGFFPYSSSRSLLAFTSWLKLMVLNFLLQVVGRRNGLVPAGNTRTLDM